MENNDSLKQRLVGAAVLISLVVVFLPMLVDDGPGPSPDRPAVPKAPEWNFSGWKDEQYQTPAQPQRPVVETIDPATIDSGVAQQDGSSPDAGEAVAGSGGSSAVAEVPGQAPDQASGQPLGDRLEATVKSGDTLYGIFRRLGLDPSQVREVVNVSGAREPLSRLRPGQRFRIRVDAHKRIIAMEYLHSGGPALRIKRIGDRLQMVTGAEQVNTVSGAAAGGASASALKTAGTSAGTSAAKTSTAAVSNKAMAGVGKTPKPSRDQGPVAWAVRIGIYKDWDAARRVQSTLRGKGYPAFLKPQQQDGIKLWHLKVGPQLKKSEAIALARKIQQEAGTKTLVVGYP